MSAYPEPRLDVSAPSHAIIPLNDATSTELMRRYQLSRDGGIFDQIYQLNAPRVERLVRACLRGAAPGLAPEDVVQDVFVSVFRSAHSFRPACEASFRTWTSQIARNAVRRALRGRTREPQESHAPIEVLPRDAAVPEASDVTDVGRDGLPIFLIGLAKALEELLPRDRAVLYEAEVLMMTYELIGKRHRMRRGTVRMVIFRARRRLYSRLESILFLLRDGR